MSENKIENAVISFRRDESGLFGIECLLNNKSIIRANDLTFDDVKETVEMFMGKVNRKYICEKSKEFAKEMTKDFSDLVDDIHKQRINKFGSLESDSAKRIF